MTCHDHDHDHDQAGTVDAQGLVTLRRPSAPRHWKSLDDLTGHGKPGGEFPGGLPGSGAPSADATRRDFLSLVGFSLAATGLGACRAPVQHAVPLAVGSEQMVPGLSTYYATTCGGCAASCSLLVKQRDGRPIKIEGNDAAPLFGGGTCATGQATVLSLYDDARLRGPSWRGQAVTWPQIDRSIDAALAGAREQKRAVVLLSGTLSSPSTRAIVADWGRRFPGFRHVVYDAVSASALRAGGADWFGRPETPHFAFDRARVVVGLEADFLGTWLSPVEFARQYASRRKPAADRSFHVQIESGLSVTGSNADLRLAVAPSELGLAAVGLLARVARLAGVEGPETAGGSEPIEGARLDTVAERLWKHRGEALVVTGSQDLAVQKLVNALNGLLGNAGPGKPIDLASPSLQRQGNDAALADLVQQMNQGQIHTLIIYGVNPGYDFPDAARFIAGLGKVALSITFADRVDETSAHVQAICPDHHFLESWADAEPVAGHYGLSQPLIAPLFDTRAATHSLRRWLGDDSSPYDHLRWFWQRNLFPRQSAATSFVELWDRSLQDGFLVLPPPQAPAGARGALTSPAPPRLDGTAAARAVLAAAQRSAAAEGAAPGTGYELHLYESVALRDGRHANNPWLQELPDPITKATWGNLAAIAPRLAKKLDLRDGDLVSLETDRGRVELPIFIQPGQHERTISVALGYGRRQAGKAGDNVGVNVFPLTAIVDGHRRYSAPVRIARTGRNEALATTQTQFSMAGRPIVLETTVAELQKEEASETEREAHPTLWSERPQGAHNWGLAINLDTCTGCSACVVACQAENNVPVVGKDQVRRTRIMHWLRIDRYYSGSEDAPESLHQPMMCQHCANAPCETVCPVLATSTSSEGLNQQAYNRCIGTRYCANNCPYKVRRFNWYNYTQNADFDFTMVSPLARMVLNPDVTVRSRGVMEKCSLCVQRIQLGKNTALKERRAMADGDVKTACQQSCPTGAITFGDLKDPDSRVSRLLADRRAYKVLDELGTRPNVGYLKKVRSGEES